MAEVAAIWANPDGSLTLRDKTGEVVHKPLRMPNWISAAAEALTTEGIEIPDGTAFYPTFAGPAYTLRRVDASALEESRTYFYAVRRVEADKP